MANIKFKAIFTYECYRLADRLARLYSLFLAVVSTSSVAAWAVWKDYPTTWALIVAAAQVLHVAKPYIPLIKHDKDFLEMSFGYEGLYLDCERLWCSFEREAVSDDVAEKQYFALREREMDIEKANKEADCPRYRFLTDYAVKETDKALARNIGGATT